MKRTLFSFTVLLCILITACAPSVDPNLAFVENLKTYLGTTDPNQIQTIGYERTDTPAYSDWMKNAELGNFVNDRGEIVPVKTVDGEPQYSLNVEREETRWVEPVASVWQTECLDKSGNRNYVVVYGSGGAGTIGRLEKNEPIIQSFACEYFAKSSAPINVLHLNFHSTSVAVQLNDVGNFGTPMPLERYDWDTTSSLASNLRTMDGTIVMSEVILNLNNLQGSAQQIGYTTNQMVTMALVNEMVGWSSGQQVTMQLQDHNEAYSTIAGITAALDPSTATLFLGSHENFVQIITNEMGVLTKIATK